MISDTVSPAIGIDLGTTYCCVAVIENGEPKIIHNTQGNNTTASYIAFSNTDVIVGDLAKELESKNIDNTIYDVKRLIGRKYNDPVLKSDINHWPFDVINENSKIKINVQYKGKRKSYFPEELSAKLLSYLKTIAEDYLDTTVNDAVITVPAYFNNSQRQATKFAAKIAGFNVLRILNEPTAAAIAYGARKNNNYNLLIYDLGGGTFDVSIIEIKDGKYTVKAVGGHNHLGGEDFNKTMVEYIIRAFERRHNIDISNDQRAVLRLHRKCERVKCILSTAESTEFVINNLFQNEDFTSSMSRRTFERLNADLFQMTIDIVDKCLKDADMDKNEIDDVVMVGGSSRIPKIKSMLQEFLLGKKISKSMNPDVSVAIGAAFMAAQLQGIPSDVREIHLHDVTSLSLGISIELDRLMCVVIKRNTPIPVSVTHTYKTLIEDQTTMNLDVFEGEEELTENNQLLGKFKLKGVSPAPAGETKCEVTFSVDVNGILTVQAKELNNNTAIEKKIVITHSGLWSDEDLIRIIEESINS